MPSCTAKKALLRGLRPNAQQKFTVHVCSRSCIFCDIWRLATLVTTHIPLSVRYPASSIAKCQRLDQEFDRSERRIQANLQTQRARVASIMSICTVEGAEESEGLHMAFDRCFNAVSELLYEEATLEERLIRPLSAIASRRPSRDIGCGADSFYYGSGRRSSRVGIAA